MMTFGLVPEKALLYTYLYLLHIIMSQVVKMKKIYICIENVIRN